MFLQAVNTEDDIEMGIRKYIIGVDTPFIGVREGSLASHDVLHLDPCTCSRECGWFKKL